MSAASEPIALATEPAVASWRVRAVARPRVLALALALALLVALAFPATVHADVADDVKALVSASLEAAYQQVMAGLFGNISGKITRELATWLTQIPNFRSSAPVDGVAGPSLGHVDAARGVTTMLALGSLSAVVTLSVIRYWLSGLSMRGSGGIEAFEGFLRSLWAVGMILLWPEAFRLTVALVNSATSTLMNWPAIQHDLAGLWGWTTVLTGAAFLLAPPIAAIVTILVVIAYVGLMLGLVAMKVMITAGLAALYVGMPLAIGLWPLPETAWVARLSARAWVACLLVPLTWTVLFVTFAAIGADFFTLQGQGGLLDKTIIKPLVAVAMLALAVTLPKKIGKAAMMGAVTPATPPGGGGAGFMGRMASSLAARRLDAAVAPGIPASLGGRPQGTPGGGGNRPGGGGSPGGGGPGGGGSPGGGGNPVATNTPSVQGAWNKAFGAHSADPAAFAAARNAAHAAFLQTNQSIRALNKKGDLAGAAKAEATAANHAYDALGHFSREQQVAMAASAHEDISGFAWNTTNSGLDPAMTAEQSQGLSTLSATPRAQLQEAFESRGVWNDGVALAGGAPPPSSPTPQPPASTPGP